MPSLPAENFDGVDFGEPNPVVIPALEVALDKLRKANPDPKAVEKLAADTVHKRNNPHTYENLFTPPPWTNPEVLTCKLCSLTIGRVYSRSAEDHPATVHVNWHNALHQSGVKSG